MILHAVQLIWRCCLYPNLHRPVHHHLRWLLVGQLDLKFSFKIFPWSCPLLPLTISRYKILRPLYSFYTISVASQLVTLPSTFCNLDSETISTSFSILLHMPMSLLKLSVTWANTLIKFCTKSCWILLSRTVGVSQDSWIEAKD